MSSGAIQRNIDAQFQVTIPNVQFGHFQHRDFPPKTMPGVFELREASFDWMLEPFRIAFHKMAAEFDDLMAQLLVEQAQEQLRDDVMRACAGNRRRQLRRK